MKINELITYLEDIIPLSSQESYDNCGLLIGNSKAELKNVLVTLDCTEAVVQEAIDKGCNLIIAHHPIIFKGIKSLTGSNYIERTVIACIKNDIALYAIHTNLDNFQFGVNKEIASRLGLKNLRILEPKTDVLYKLVVFVPETHHDQLSKAVFSAGAGTIGNYEECQFVSEGIGTFKPKEGASPFTGELDELSQIKELKAEFLVSSHRLRKVIKAMNDSHPYEEVAHDIIPLKNVNQNEGSGMIGEFEMAMDESEILKKIKSTFNCGIIRHTNLRNKPIKTVALCGGSGSFLLRKSIAEQADIFITSDFKYHEFFDAEDEILIADIGHYESEQFTSNLLTAILKGKFTTFAVHLTGVNTNPINYF
jgi:dinuclear metal center YbgI/SA1388 family protein